MSTKLTLRRNGVQPGIVKRSCTMKLILSYAAAVDSVPRTVLFRPLAVSVNSLMSLIERDVSSAGLASRNAHLAQLAVVKYSS